MFEFQLPDVGEGVAEGEVVAWHVEVGDEVVEDEVVAEVETDKAVVDVPIPVSGTVVERHAEVGEILPVGDTLISIETGEGDAAAEADVEAEVEPAGAARDSTGPESEPAEAESESTGASADVAGGVESESTPLATETPTDGEEPDVPTGRVFAPPRVRRLARELGIALAAVEGSGPGGRVTEWDVREAAEAAEAVTAEASEAGAAEASEAGAAEASEAGAAEAVEGGAVDAAEAGATGGPETGAANEVPAVAGAPAGVPGGGGESTAQPAGIEPADRDRTLAVPATRALAEDLGVDIDAVPTDETRDGEAFVTAEAVRSLAEARETAGAAGAAEPAGTARAGAGRAATAEDGAARVEPYRGVRRTIGEKMEESKYTAPHVSHHDSVDVSALVEARAAMTERAADRGVKITYVPFVLKAIVAGLREYPILNSELDEEAEEIRIKGEYNVGIATATDAGLMVPVVKRVDEKGILQLASEVNELTRKARERTIDLEEMQGGTFSITNFGAIGGEYATPIINYPETAILGLGAIEERPWVDDGEVVARPVLPLSLSIDHRVIDGAEAAQFTNTVMEYLANPSLLLLED